MNYREIHGEDYKNRFRWETKKLNYSLVVQDRSYTAT